MQVSCKIHTSITLREGSYLNIKFYNISVYSYVNISYKTKVLNL